jgi:hypothetical protein
MTILHLRGVQSAHLKQEVVGQSRPENIEDLSHLSPTNSAYHSDWSYAKKFNEKFNTTEDTIVELVERFIDAIIEKDPDLPDFLKELGEEFRNRNPQYKEFADIYADMVQMSANKKERVKLKNMLINASIQRVVDSDWILDIVGKFDPFFVNIVRLYPYDIDPDAETQYRRKGLFAIWDGQHTTLALISVAMFAFGMSLKEAMELEIPVAIYPGRDISKLRKRFIGVHDDTMTKPLDKIDLYMQHVWSVRNNGDKDPWSVRFEEIQSALEEFNCFFTHEKFGDTDEPGAVSRPSEIFPATGRDVNKWKSSVLRRVFQYHNMFLSDKPIEPLEIDNMAHIFRACDVQGITVDDDYVREFGKYLGAVTENTWRKHTSKKSKMIKEAYQSWYERQYAQVKSAYNERCNQTEVAPTWICQAIAKAGFSKELPIFTGKFQYDFKKKELG